MAKYNLVLAAAILSIPVVGAYADDLDNQVYLTNSSSNKLSYAVVANPGDGSSQMMSSFLPPGSSSVEVFTITTGGQCLGNEKTTTYPIQVIGEHRLVLCQFDLVVDVTNGEPVSAADAEVGTGCSTTGSLMTVKIENLEKYSNGSSDYCSSVSWSGQDESQNMYGAGQLKIVISSK